MKHLNQILGVFFMLGSFFDVSYQDSAPYFLTLARNQIDGDLYNRLTIQGLEENLPVGQVIGQLRCGDDDNDNLTYSVAGNTLKVLANGTVMINRQLDRENTPANSVDEVGSRILLQTFTCTDPRRLSAKVNIEIVIGDKNDNRPTFKSTADNSAHSGTIREDDTVGTVVQLKQNLRITDRDRGKNSEVLVTCWAPPGDEEARLACEHFEIRSRGVAEGTYNATIYLKKVVDYEVKRSYTMTVMAKDTGFEGEPQLNSTINILIDVIDTQDSSPEFLNVPLIVYIQENVEIGFSVQTLLSAQDQDLGNPRPLRISILDDPKSLFTIGGSVPDVDGKIYKAPIITRAIIDREELKGLYMFRVKATELENGAETNFTVISNVTVNIQDENDNAPKFQQSNYEVNVTELASGENTQIANLNIQITDPDDTSNAKYQVLIGRQTFPNAFSVFPSGNVTGNVAVSLRTQSDYLDYDNPMYRRHVIYIEAREIGGNQTSTATVTINVIDLNDNSPVFPKDNYEKTLREDTAVGFSIITITATDIDEGVKGQVVYSLRGTDLDVFTLNSQTGELRLAKALDYEDQTEYPIIFVATDQGSPPRETTTSFTLRVTDFNDLAPEFIQDSYQTYASESSTQLLPEIKVQATDPENPNGTIRYAIISGNIDNAFVIDPVTGALSLTSPIDFDKTNNGVITLTVQASDQAIPGQPSLRSTATIRINLQDENNHAPVFNPTSYSSTISEVTPSGTSVVQVTATDSDSGDNGVVQYFIDRGGLDNFDVNRITGLMTVSSRAKFDYDANKEYNVVVYAIDSGGPPQTGTTTVKITMTDANNKNPVIPQQLYTVSVQDDASIGTVLIQINATDSDSASNLEYSIPQASIIAKDSGGSEIRDISEFDYRKSVVIDRKTGVVKTNLKLNRDNAAEIGFQVEVEDVASQAGVQTASTSVIVTVLGTKPSAITFISPWTINSPNYYFTINEDQNINSSILTLSARDPICVCPIKTFRMVSQSLPDFFRLDGSAVVLNKALDYEDTRQRVLNVVLEAISDDLSRTATATVVVSVSDDNDNSPIFFNRTEYRFTVSENARYPVSIGSIFASDEDSGSYGQVEYSLSGQYVGDFSINRLSGDIYVSNNTQLDYETRKLYNLQAIAQDNPSANNNAFEIRKQSSIQLRIDVTDENDNAPIFNTNDTYNFYTAESFEVGNAVGQVSATDSDSGTNAEITYSIVGGTAEATSLFYINPSTGVIITQQSLRGRSVFSPYLLRVRAKDRGRIPKHTDFNVRVHISSGQLNDGSPIFSFPEPNRNIAVIENSPIGTHVIQVKGISRSNAPIQYKFVTNTNSDYEKFSIDPVSGNITVNGVIDREEQPTYRLVVAVRDTVNKSETLRMLTVTVLDADDNEPSFNPNQKYAACKDKGLPVPVELRMVEELPVDTYVYTVEACDPDSGPNTIKYYPVKTGICKNEMEKENFKVSENGTIFINKVLDREVQEIHLVCVGIVRNQRRRRAVYNRTAMVNTNDIAYIEITLTDLNDNTPTFSSSMIQHVLLSIPTSEQVLQVSATDNDLLPFNRVRYSITSIQYVGPSSTIALPGAFLINPDTGIISVGFPTYSEFAGYYFIVDVLAEDFNNATMNHKTSVYIFIFDKLQSMRFVLNESPDKSVKKAESILEELNEKTTGSDFKVQRISYHTDSRGNKDVSRTDVCFVIVREQRVMSIKEGESLINENNDYNEVLKKYGVVDKGSCYYTSASTARIYWSDLWWILVFVAIFIFVCCFILIIAICILHKNYKDYMKTRKIYMVPG